MKTTAEREHSRTWGGWREETSQGLNKLFICGTHCYSLGNLSYSGIKKDYIHFMNDTTDFSPRLVHAEIPMISTCIKNKYICETSIVNLILIVRQDSAVKMWA